MNKKLVFAMLEPDLFVNAVYEEDRLMELSCHMKGEDSILGNIYIGKVQNVVKNINAAFIQFSKEDKGYYSLEQMKDPIFTNKIGKKDLCVGDELLVQVQKEALKTKDPVLSTNLNFSGEYLVLTTENTKTGVSGKLNMIQRQKFRELIEKNKSPEYGIIVRTNAKNASDEDILQELHDLEQEFFHLKDTAVHKTCFSLVYQQKKGMHKILQDTDYGNLNEIVTDDKESYDEILSFYANRPGFEGKIRYYQDAMQSLSSLYNLKGELENAQKERVWLKSGAYLIIQPTEALTVIDVNSGKNVSKKSIQENFLKINVEAAKEIARQLRLRNISGICVVDFINMDTKEAEDVLMQEFRMELKKDPIATQLIDITKLGLVEITRKKVRKTLKEQIYCRKSIDE